MATVSAAKRSIDVTLIRPDADPRTFTLPEGATLADLLRAAGAASRGPSLLIDGRPIEDVTILDSGMTITIEAEDGARRSNGSWQSTVGMFSHPEFLREVIAEGRAIREQDREAARSEAQQDDR
jgi:hypothetical protein